MVRCDFFCGFPSIAGDGDLVPRFFQHADGDFFVERIACGEQHWARWSGPAGVVVKGRAVSSGLVAAQGPIHTVK